MLRLELSELELAWAVSRRPECRVEFALYNFQERIHELVRRHPLSLDALSMLLHVKVARRAHSACHLLI